MNNRPKRVLHVVRAMDRGGVETWLMNVLRNLDGRRVHMDFLVHTGKPGAYDAEILDRGARLLRCSAALWSPGYALQFGRFLHQSEPYHVIHSHVHHFSGYLVTLARRLGVPSRIVHSHSDTSRLDGRANWFRRCYLGLTEDWIHANATRLAAVSRAAARALFGAKWEADSRSLLLRCGIDLRPFRRSPERSAVRALWDIEDSEFVIGHVGRFQAPKNHAFLLDIAAEAIRRQPRTRLLLIGDGPLRGSLEARARQSGFREKIIFAGVRDDVPRLLQAMDVFVAPSLWEGLPLTLLEAQAAGLPCVVADVISEEADVVPALVRRKSLTKEAREWAADVLAACERPAPGKAAALSLVENSSFNILRCTDQLYALYGA